MGDGMSDAYADQRYWETAIKKLTAVEDEALKDEEYSNLVDANVAILELIRQQLVAFGDIYAARSKYIKEHGCDSQYVDDYLDDLDFNRGRRTVSKWALRDLIKS